MDHHHYNHQIIPFSIEHCFVPKMRFHLLRKTQLNRETLKWMTRTGFVYICKRLDEWSIRLASWSPICQNDNCTNQFTAKPTINIVRATLTAIQ